MKNKIKILVFVLFISIILQLVFGETSSFNNVSRSYDTLYTYNGTPLEISGRNLSRKTQISSITVIPNYSTTETEEVSLTGWWYGTNTMDWLREIRDELIIDTFGTKHNTYDKTTYYEGIKPKKDWKIYVEQNGNMLYGKSEEMTLTGTINGNSVSFTGVWNTYRKWENPPCVFTNTYETENFEGVVSKGGDMYILVGTLTGDRGYYEECHTVEPDYWQDYYETINLTWGGTFITYIEPGAIKVIHLEALDTIEIREYPSEIIWESIEPSKYAPIAFPKSKSFTIRAVVGAPMKPPWKPVGKYIWYIPYQDKYDEGMLNLREIGYYPFFGGEEMFLWQAEFEVTTPDLVGKDNLILEFKLYDDKGKLVNDQNMNHVLYVTYDEPIERIIDIETKKPKERWLELATKWASDAKNDVEVVFKTTYNINYNSGWSYQSHSGVDHPTNPYVYGIKLIEGTSGYGSCGSFKEVLQILSAVLGIIVSEDSIVRPLPFLTEPLISLDGNTGNAYKIGKIWIQRDRWVFNDHVTGEYLNKYYDPTFRNNIGYTDREKNIYCDSIYYNIIKRAYYCIKGNNTAYLYPQSSEPPWGRWIYENNPRIFAQTNEILTENISNFLDYGLDIDANSLYDFLVIEIKVNTTKVDNYSIFGTLSYNQSYIGFLTEYIYVDMPKTIKLYFDGKRLYEGKINGNYIVELTLLDKDGAQIDYKKFNTSFYNYKQFQGFLADLAGISDYGSDKDSDSLFDFLTVGINLDVISSKNFTIQGILYSNNSSIDFATNYTYLNKGNKIVYLNFNGPKIYESKINGPYHLELILFDGNYYKTISYNTRYYKYTDFQPEPCIEPKNKMLIRENTKFCPGTYSISNGIEIDKDNIILDCNNAVLVGNNFGNGIYLFGQKGITIKNCIIKYYNNGISLNHSYHTKINFNSANNNNFGVYLFESDNNTINNNNISNNIYHGVFAENSLGLSIYSNIMKSNGYGGDYGYGTYIRYGSDANIKNNIISNNSGTRYAYGIKIKEFSNIIIQDNTISGNKDNAIQIEFSDNITLKDNNLISNKGGIYLNTSNNNKIYHNDIINNNLQAFDNGNNYWDNGIKEGGNYWSNYDEDIEGCNDINKDGYCDLPYSIPTKGIDNYPFNKKDAWVKDIFHINISSGWSLISIPLNLSNNSVNYLFKNESVTILGYKNNSWFIPELIDNKLGYWVKINQNLNLTLEGIKLNDKISLNKNWNLISYSSLDIININKSELKNYTILTYTNNSWSSYIPNRTFNSLQTLKPGYGYWVNVN